MPGGLSLRSAVVCSKSFHRRPQRRLRFVLVLLRYLPVGLLVLLRKNTGVQAVSCCCCCESPFDLALVLQSLPVGSLICGGEGSLGYSDVLVVMESLLIQNIGLTPLVEATDN